MLNKVYDELYTGFDYNNPFVTQNDTKWDLIRMLIPPETKTAVDLGCGRGFYLYQMGCIGINAIGVEFSKVCCDKYLRDMQYWNKDIKEFLKTADRTDFVLCMDVLEHLPESDVDEVLEGIYRITDHAVIGVANHSDVINGVELHLIQQDIEWWTKKIVNAIDRYNLGNHYIFECYNA